MLIYLISGLYLIAYYRLVMLHFPRVPSAFLPFVYFVLQTCLKVFLKLDLLIAACHCLLELQ